MVPGAERTEGTERGDRGDTARGQSEGTPAGPRQRGEPGPAHPAQATPPGAQPIASPNGSCGCALGHALFPAPAR